MLCFSKGVLQDLLRTLSDALMAAQQPAPAMEASKLAEVIDIPDAAVDSFLHSQRQRRNCSHGMLSKCNVNVLTEQLSMCNQYNNISMDVFPTKLPALLPSKGSLYHKRQAAVSLEALLAAEPKLESARCSLADSCSSFTFRDTMQNNRPPRLQLSSSSKCHSKPISEQEANQQLPWPETQVHMQYATVVKSANATTVQHECTDALLLAGPRVCPLVRYESASYYRNKMC